LNKSGESGHPCLVPELSGNTFSFSPLSTMLAVGVSFKAFFIWRCYPSIPNLFRDFTIREC
jgi:hypothetical protein